MEKKIIIDFLNEHWEEFAALLSEATDTGTARIPAEHFPDDLYEFALLLSNILSAYRIQAPNNRLPTANKAIASVGLLGSAKILDSAHKDTKGLLEKAAQFRKADSFNEDTTSSIVLKNGLFTVQPQHPTQVLDTSFKKLVDSVL